jgi:hypothetical protein
MKLAKIIKHCRIDKPQKFKFADFDPAETFGLPTGHGCRRQGRRHQAHDGGRQSAGELLDTRRLEGVDGAALDDRLRRDRRGD